MLKPSIMQRLDLDKWINDPPSESSEEEEDDDDRNTVFLSNSSYQTG